MGLTRGAIDVRIIPYNWLNIRRGIVPKNRERSTPVMRKEYEAPFCKVVAVDKQDILTTSTGSYQTAERNDTEVGEFKDGAFINWGKW